MPALLKCKCRDVFIVDNSHCISAANTQIRRLATFSQKRRRDANIHCATPALCPFAIYSSLKT